jgi:hypothetical protein
MEADAILDRLTAAGLSVVCDGEALRVAPASRLNDELRALIRAHKTALLVALSCPQGHALRAGLCWLCNDRRCRDCGRWTGSALRSFCVAVCANVPPDVTRCAACGVRCFGAASCPRCGAPVAGGGA